MIDTEALRKKVIDLAIQGKLTEQLPSDGDAETLYAQILDHKSQLIKEGKIKKETPLPDIAADEIPFEIPGNWKWVHMGDIFEHNTGKALNNADKEGTQLEYITTSNMYWDHFELDNLKSMFFKESEIEKCTIRKGDLLICEGGDIGRSAIWNFDYEMRIQNHIHKLRGYGGIDHRFYFYMMRNYKDSGMIDGRGIGLQGFSSKRVHSLVVPLAPLAEQKRIADKLEEVLAQIDIIDDLQAKYCNDLAVLKSKIIDAGIQGKLTEQLPEDGDAEDLYAQILNKKGLLMSKMVNGEINTQAMSFTIPQTWKMVEFGEIFDFVDYRGKTPNKIEDGIFLVTASNIKKGFMDYTRKEYISLEEYQTRKSRGITKRGDILFTTEAPMGNAALCDLDECSCGQRVITFQPYHREGIYPELFMYFILSAQFQKELLDNASGTTAKGIKADRLKRFLIPLPPYAEQERIAKRINTILEKMN